MIDRYDLDLNRNEIYGSKTGKWVVYSDHEDEIMHMKDAIATLVSCYEEQLAKRNGKYCKLIQENTRLKKANK